MDGCSTALTADACSALQSLLPDYHPLAILCSLLTCEWVKVVLLHVRLFSRRHPACLSDLFTLVSGVKKTF